MTILTESDWVLKILSLDCVDSTQSYLIERLKSQTVHAPVAVVAAEQRHGRGSRDNSWISHKGNLFVSFAVPREMLPEDLKLESSSIYFSMLLKEILQKHGSNVWLKWPNDFYLGEQKIGGTITTLIENIVVCGIGLNMRSAPQRFETLDVCMDIDDLLTQYFALLKSCPSWKQIFSKFELEFYKSQKFFTHIKGSEISLQAVVLQYDGSVEYNGEKVYSLR